MSTTCNHLTHPEHWPGDIGDIGELRCPANPTPILTAVRHWEWTPAGQMPTTVTPGAAAEGSPRSKALTADDLRTLS